MVRWLRTMPRSMRAALLILLGVCWLIAVGWLKVDRFALCAPWSMDRRIVVLEQDAHDARIRILELERVVYNLTTARGR